MVLASPPNDHTLLGSTFAGHTVVFTGKLSSLGRKEATALVERLGGSAEREVTARTTMLVIGGEGFTGSPDRIAAAGTGRGQFDKSRKLRKAEEVNAKSPGRVKILDEDEFCRLGGVPSHAALSQRYHSARRIRELYPLVGGARLRHLEAWGLVRPVVRTNADTYYSFRDVAIIKQVHDELQQNPSFRGVVRRQLAARGFEVGANEPLEQFQVLGMPGEQVLRHRIQLREFGNGLALVLDHAGVDDVQGRQVLIGERPLQ